jgi:hypothetical protein
VLAASSVRKRKIVSHPSQDTLLHVLQVLLQVKVDVQRCGFQCIGSKQWPCLLDE